MPLAGEDRDHSDGVVSPVLAGFGGKRRRIKVPLLLVVLRVDGDLAVGARRNGSQRGKVNGHGHHKALGVIGVLADQVNAARGHKDGRLRMEAGDVHGTQNGRIVHESSLLEWF